MIKLPPPSKRHATIVLIILFAGLVWPAILWGNDSRWDESSQKWLDATSEASDQRQYHYPVILTMAQQWPRVDLKNYKSATAPGYHLFMALIHRSLTTNLTIARLISSLFGLGMLLVVFSFLTMRLEQWHALALTLPLLGSSHVLSGSIWLTTDNAAWMFVALAFGGATLLNPTPARIALGSLWTTFAVFIRQIHIWLIGPIALASLLTLRERWQPRVFAAAILLILPLMLLASFILLWHGLIPPGDPSIREFHGRGLNPATVPFVLSLIGAFGVFLLPTFGRLDIRAIMHDRMLWLAIALALLVSIAVPTSYTSPETPEGHAAGRWGGALWLVVEHLPTIAHRNLLFPLLSMLGAAIVLIGWRAAAAAGNARLASLLLGGFACWLAAQSMNPQVFQRYCEPMVLITLAWLTSLAVSLERSTAASPLAACTGPVMLGIIQLLVSIKTAYFPIIHGPG